MWAALSGRGWLGEKQKIVLIGCVSGTMTRDEGVQKSQISADVICERPRRRRRGESEGVCVKPRKREGIAARHLGQAQVHR